MCFLSLLCVKAAKISRLTSSDGDLGCGRRCCPWSPGCPWLSCGFLGVRVTPTPRLHTEGQTGDTAGPLSPRTLLCDLVSKPLPLFPRSHRTELSHISGHPQRLEPRCSSSSSSAAGACGWWGWNRCGQQGWDERSVPWDASSSVAAVWWQPAPSLPFSLAVPGVWRRSAAFSRLFSRTQWPWIAFV